jgi:hypothetical protein
MGPITLEISSEEETFFVFHYAFTSVSVSVMPIHGRAISPHLYMTENEQTLSRYHCTSLHGLTSSHHDQYH